VALFAEHALMAGPVSREINFDLRHVVATGNEPDPFPMPFLVR